MSWKGMIFESIVAPSQCCRRPIISNGVPQRLPLVLLLLLSDLLKSGLAVWQSMYNEL